MELHPHNNYTIRFPGATVRMRGRGSETERAPSASRDNLGAFERGGPEGKRNKTTNNMCSHEVLGPNKAQDGVASTNN